MNRFIKDSIWTSPNLNELSDLAERHFYRLLPLPDDHGCCELTPAVVKGRCYPLKDKVTVKDIQNWTQELVEQDIIRTWEERGRLYGYFPTWSQHQRIRSLNTRKTPVPPKNILINKVEQERSSSKDIEDTQLEEMSAFEEFEHLDDSIPKDIDLKGKVIDESDDNCRQLETIGNNCEQLTTVDRFIPPLSSPSSPLSSPSSVVHVDCNAPPGGESDKPAVVRKSSQRLPPQTDAEWLEQLKASEAYKHIDFPRELSKMDAWLSTPKGRGRKKTRSFILNWLNKVEPPIAAVTAIERGSGAHAWLKKKLAETERRS